MENKIHYNVKFTEDQLLRFLNKYRIYNPKKFDSNQDFVEITIAIFAKRHFEKITKNKLLVAFEMKQKLNITTTELNNPSVVKRALAKRNQDTLIDFMIVAVNNTSVAYAFQIKRFFIEVSDKNIEELLAEKINYYLQLKVSQEISLIISPDKHQKILIWPTKINLTKLRKLVNNPKDSYRQIFIMFDNNLIEIKS